MAVRKPTRLARSFGESSVPPAPAPVRVIVGEPASPFRASVSAQLARDASLDVAAVGSSDGIVKACAFRRPNVALVAMHLPPDGGLATIERIAVVAPAARIMVWSDDLDGNSAVAAIRSGARGIVDRNIPAQALIRCIKEVAAGHLALPRHLVGTVLDELQCVERLGRARFDHAALTTREREVLELIGGGHTNRTIAVRLGLSEFTIKRHVHNLLLKLAVPSRSAAAAIYGSANANEPGGVRAPRPPT